MASSKQNIINAAILIFNNDFSATTEVIAEKAGVTRRTLHRYFADRKELIKACKADMEQVCRATMLNAYKSSTQPLLQLEAMLYAGIECGSKYAFLDKLYQRGVYNEPVQETAGEFENVKVMWFKLISNLQQQHIINPKLAPAWIFAFFGSIISATISALQSEKIAKHDIKEFAWYSFSSGIGINKTHL